MQHPSINPRIAALSPLQAGKPVDEVARELGINDIVKLASNENPRGGEKVQQAIAQAATELSRYPMAAASYQKQQLGEKIGVEPSQLTLGNGSNDVLDLIARVVLEPGIEAIIAQHNCGLPIGGHLLRRRLSDGAGERTSRSDCNAGSDH